MKKIFKTLKEKSFEMCSIKLFVSKNMIQFFLGFSLGIYMGTIYNFKPTINFLIKEFKLSFPEEAIPKKINIRPECLFFYCFLKK